MWIFKKSNRPLLIEIQELTEELKSTKAQLKKVERDYRELVALLVAKRDRKLISTATTGNLRSESHEPEDDKDH